MVNRKLICRCEYIMKKFRGIHAFQSEKSRYASSLPMCLLRYLPGQRDKISLVAKGSTSGICV